MQKIIYALVDPRTNRARYIGKSERGLLRPLGHRDAGHSMALTAWLRDLKECSCEYITLVLAEADTSEQLAMFEAYWIALGHRFGWPLTNKARPKDTLPDEPIVGHWSVQKWRRDPEVKNKLISVREGRGSWKKSKNS